MALFPRPQEKRQREQQARGATPALQPSVYRRDMFRRGNSPIAQPSIARPGAFAGQPKIRLEGGGLGGQARIPDSLPQKTSTGPVKNASPAPVGNRQPGQPIIKPEMGNVPALGGGARRRLGPLTAERDAELYERRNAYNLRDIPGIAFGITKGVGIEGISPLDPNYKEDPLKSLPGHYGKGVASQENAEKGQMATFPPSPSGEQLFPNEGPLKNAPPSSTSKEALRRSSQRDGFLTNGIRLAPDASLRSGLQAKEPLSMETREQLRDTMGEPQPTTQYYGSMVAPETSAGSGTVILPGQEDSVSRQRMRDQLTRSQPGNITSESGLNEQEAAAIAGRMAGLRNDINNMSTSRNRNELFSSVTGDTDMSNYGEVSAFRSGGGGFPTIPTTAEARLQIRERQARAGTGDPLSAAEQSQLSEFRAKNYAREQGLPYIPPSAPRQETSRRNLPDVTADAGSRDDRTTPESAARRNENDSLPSNQLRRRSTVNRQTMGDGTQVTFGMGTAENPMRVEDGNIIISSDTIKDEDGNDKTRRRAVVLPSSGYSLGLRTAEIDDDGNFIPGTFRTQSDQARREERQDLAIARGNAPGATPEEKVAGQQAQSAKDKFAAYKERMRDRREGSRELRTRTAQMQGMYPGVSRAGAAGMAQTEMNAEERMQQQMKQQQDNEMARRRQDMLLEAYKANPNDPRLQDAFAKDLGLRDRTSDEQARFDQDQFNLKINNMTQNNELTMDPRQVPGAGVGDLDTPTKSMLVAGIDDALKSDLLTDEDRMKLFRNVDLKVMAELIDGTEFDELYFDGDQSERVYKDFKAFLKRTGQVESKPENDFYQSGTLGGPNDMF